MSDTTAPRTNFIHHIIAADLASGKHQRIATRFPPEPNGYLHIGHAKSIALNFGLAEEFGGTCNLRFDDTNPLKENHEFVNAIQYDVRWLGYDWGERLYFASDYFTQLYEFALELIEKGLAYVCDLSADQMRDYRGTLTVPGRDSPYRDRSIADNRALFERMRAGVFPDGSRTLRARIDMTSPNLNLRDPVLYRIKHGVIHHQTGSAWCLYPTYDFTHPLSDALEGITHSICTLEFEDHRPLYDWCVANVSVPKFPQPLSDQSPQPPVVEEKSPQPPFAKGGLSSPPFAKGGLSLPPFEKGGEGGFVNERWNPPQQIEFSRLNLEYCVMSKRLLTQLVTEQLVNGWDDPRMPTIAGLRRRGYTPAALREFCARIGVTRADNLVEMELLESTVREDLDVHAPRAMAVLRPLKVVLENVPADQIEQLTASNHPKDQSLGTRQLPFRRELYIDQNDFAEQPPPGFKRLTLGGEVRLRNAYVIRCTQVMRAADGSIAELRATADLNTLGKNPQGRKVAGVIHWVAVATAQVAEVRLYDRLFAVPIPGAGGSDFRVDLNPKSLQVLTGCVVEPSLVTAAVGSHYQFEREGYFVVDPDSTAQRPVFNLTVTLRDTWGKSQARAGGDRV